MQKRFQSYAWVTWLAQLMSGEKQCQLPFQLRTQYHIPTPASDYDCSEHDDMVNQRAIELEKQGFTVYIEQQNSFKVNGQRIKICIAGRPDIIAVKDDWVVVEDCKTGRKRSSHRFQVLLYMMLLPLALETKERCLNQIPHGRLIYADQIVDIPTWLVNEPFKEHLRQILTMLTDKNISQHQPSSWECRYCSLTSEYCAAKRNIA